MTKEQIKEQKDKHLSQLKKEEENLLKAQKQQDKRKIKEYTFGVKYLKRCIKNCDELLK